MKFINKTIVITGGSRGIGEAISLKFAEYGANLVIFAKEDENGLNAITNKIIDAGGKAFAIDVDLQDESAIHNEITKVVDYFGDIDVLINNASAFCFTDAVNTSPEKFDLLMATNIRATYFMSRHCLEYLKKSSNPHVINIAPPLDMDAKWFKKHLAFTISKCGMSMCTLGMAEEFRHLGVAVNSLWPQTTIATSTIKTHFRPEIYAGSRWPSIMADAALILARRNAQECTGNFFVDEFLLRESGVTDFSHYAVDPNAPLILDLFITEKVDNKSVLPFSYDMFAEIKV